MSVDYFTLRTELINDPWHIGYSGYLAVNDFINTANLLNADGSGHVLAPSGYMVWRNDISPREVINVWQPADFFAVTQINATKLELLFQGAPIDATQNGIRANFSNIFSGTATMLSGFLSGIASTLGSRAEVLFGYGTSISDSQVSFALTQTSGISG